MTRVSSTTRASRRTGSPACSSTKSGLPRPRRAHPREVAVRGSAVPLSRGEGPFDLEHVELTLTAGFGEPLQRVAHAAECAMTAAGPRASGPRLVAVEERAQGGIDERG